MVWLFGKARTAMQGHSGDPKLVTLNPLSPARRRFLEQTAVLASATGFAAAGYALLYGRQNVEVVRQRIRLVHVPVFEGFRIAQLSDVHIGLFTTADYIRHCVTITNTLKADLIVLAGDCICWDPRLNV